MTYDATCSTMSRLFSHELTQEDLFLKFCETEEDGIIWFRVVKKYFFSKKALLSVYFQKFDEIELSSRNHAKDNFLFSLN